MKLKYSAERTINMDNSKKDKSLNEIKSLLDSDSENSVSVDMNSSAKSEHCHSNILNSSVVTKESGYIEPRKTYTYTTIPSSMSNDFLPLMSIPDVALEKILSFLSYDQVAQMRIICKRMNWACQAHLNRGFRAAEQYHTKCLKDVRAKLPRRESSRREHPYSRHCDILTAIGTRISLLAMTFSKFIDIELSCFIPGKVIDEIFRVLRICNEKNPPRAFEVLQELRDISSMAMEYFDEKIVPSFKFNPHSPITASMTTTNSCDLHGSSSISPSKILSGSFMPVAGPSYLGVPPILSSPVFGTSYSTPKSRLPSIVDKPLLLQRFNDTSGNRTSDILSPVEKTLLDSIKDSHRMMETTVKRQRRMIRKMQKEMKLQREKIVELEKTVNSQETLIVSQGEKLKEHDNMFTEISKQSKEHIKIDLSTREKEIMTRPINYENYSEKTTSSYVPQFLLQSPSRAPTVKSTKRRLPNSTEDQSSECKRKRISKFEDGDLSIIRCGALAAIANKKK